MENKITVRLAESFDDAINKAEPKEVIALGPLGWVLVSKGHPLLKTVRNFTKTEAKALGVKVALKRSTEPNPVIL